MKTIWKFPLDLSNRQRIEMPKRAEVLTVQTQGAVLVLWALVDVDDDKTQTEARTFDIYETGQKLPDIDRLTNSRKYLGTVQDESGAQVWHVFEIV